MSQSILHAILERGPFAPMTRNKYSYVIDSWIQFAGSDPGGWTRKAAQRFYDEAKERMTVRSANVYIASLRYVSKWYAIQENDPSLDFALVQISGASYEKASSRRSLSGRETADLLNTCSTGKPADMRDFALMVWGFETGMRRTSLAGCAFEKLGSHHEYPFIKVPIKGSAGIQTWNVPLSDLCLEALEPWKRWLKKEHHNKGPIFCQLKRHVTPQDRLVHLPGEELSTYSIYKIVKQRGKNADILNMYPHVLRHTFITWRKLAKVPEEQIASITGHAPDVGWKSMSTYLDVALVGKTARET